MLNYKPFRKTTVEKSLGSKARQRILRFDNKNTIIVGKPGKLDFTGIKSFCSVKGHVGRPRKWAAD